MRLLVDMNLSPRWVEGLGESGIEAVHWSTVGAHDAQDAVIMAYARANDYVVLTHDLDFSSILAATGGEKPSVIQIRGGDVSPEAIGEQVRSAILQMSDVLEEGALVTIDTRRTRLRVLPLNLGNDRATS